MRVRVISTGSVRIRPEHVASNGTPIAWWLLTSRRWTAPRPINVYVIEHESGLVLFDTGQDRASLTDPGYFPGGIVGWLYRRLARFDIDPDETLRSGLARLGVDLADVTHVVLSHLHQDHIGGLAEIAALTHQPRIVASAAEFAQVGKRGAVLDGIMTNHIDLPGLDWDLVESGRDLMGDGRLVIVPTPGHTPGSISLLVTEPGAVPLLLVGDLTYDVQLFQRGRVPGVGKRRGLAESTAIAHELAEQHPGLVVLAAHDPAAAQLLAEARP